MECGKHALAIDIGGSKLLTGLIDQNGRVLDKRKFILPDGANEKLIIEKICEMSHEYKNASCCGITIPGLADYDKGLWVYAPFSGISNVPIAEILSEKLGLPAFVDNDVNACAIGEKIYGACAETENFLWITISNGVGGGLILNGEIYRGKDNSAGEIGHFIVEENSKCKCGCGNYGCLEAVASGAAISNIYRSITGMERSALEIACEAKAGNKIAMELYDNAAYYIGKAIGYSANLLNLEKVILGGGVSRDFELLYPSVLRAADRYIFKAANKNIKIEKTSLGYDAALIGCAAVARKGTGEIKC